MTKATTKPTQKAPAKTDAKAATDKVTIKIISDNVYISNELVAKDTTVEVDQSQADFLIKCKVAEVSD